MRFIALDVETANADLASICQIGVVVFEGGSVAETWETLVDPEDYFAGTNVAVHGIGPEAVKDAPKFPEVFGRLAGYLSGEVVAHHTAFDRVSVSRVADKHGLGAIDCRWLDTARVVRRAWAEFSERGYGLANVAKSLGVGFRHHEAGEDARAAGEILLRAIQHSGTSLEGWLTQATKYDHSTRREGDPDGPLGGETLVFTGRLSITRKDAANMAARSGCDVGESVTKATTIVVVGDADIRQASAVDKSNKHRKAEDLIAKGQAIRILSEGDFSRLVGIQPGPG